MDIRTDYRDSLTQKEGETFSAFLGRASAQAYHMEMEATDFSQEGADPTQVFIGSVHMHCLQPPVGVTWPVNIPARYILTFGVVVTKEKA